MVCAACQAFIGVADYANSDTSVTVDDRSKQVYLVWRRQFFATFSKHSLISLRCRLPCEARRSTADSLRWYFIDSAIAICRHEEASQDAGKLSGVSRSVA